MNFPVFFIIAGEASGDILGARLMRALKKKMNGQIRFAGIGGPLMAAEGLDVFFSYTELMHFGIVEVVRHIPRLLSLISKTSDEVIRTRPAALITIDAPDFSFRVSKRVRSHLEISVPLIHYVAPTVWAWRPGRAKKVARFLDHLLAVLPFEPPYFTREGLGCTFVGHSIVESDVGNGSNAIFRAAHGIEADVPLMTVLPGSRGSELARLLPVLCGAVRLLHARYPRLEIIVPTLSHLKGRIESELASWGIPFHVVEGEREKYDAFAASTVALACSGTVALELALARLPSVIVYKMNSLTVAIFRHFVRVRFANLVNIMHNKMVVPELLQDECTAENCAKAVDLLLRDDGARKTQIASLASTASWLGQGQFIPSEKAADTIIDVIQRRDPTLLLPPLSRNTRVQPPTILQVLPSLVTGGVERGTVETVTALVKAGYRAVVASAGGPMATEVEAAGGIHISLPLKSKNPFTLWRNVDGLARTIARYRIDLVHARSRAPAWSSLLAARRARVPFVTTFHSAYGARSYIKRLYNSVMAKGVRVIAISNFVGRYAQALYKVPDEILRIIPRGVDLDNFDPSLVTAERLETLRRAWNVGINTPVILMPGRFTRWKGQSILVQALSIVQSQNYVCVLIGGGKRGRFGKELSRMIRQKGLGRNVALFDTCRDMAAAYCLADLVVVPSIRPEGFGRVVIEAQAMGVPVIAANHGGAAETVIDGITGYLTKPGSPVELAKAIDAVLSLPAAERKTLSARARSHIQDHFTTTAMTTKTLAVYQELLASRVPS